MPTGTPWLLWDAAPENPQVLTLEGNPLVQLPNYRAHVVTLLPRLQTLDGKVVSAEECERAAVAVQAEAACMAVMLSNACLVHKLVGGLGMALHMPNAATETWQNTAQHFYGCMVSILWCAGRSPLFREAPLKARGYMRAPPQAEVDDNNKTGS